MEEKDFYTIKDIEKRFNVSTSVAQKKMREAKHYADTLGVSGKILKVDFEAWMTHLSSLKSEERKGNEMAFAMVCGLIPLLSRCQLEQALFQKGYKIYAPDEKYELRTNHD